MVASQGTTLSQLTEQVSEIKQSHKTMLDHFDQLATQMATLIANLASSPKKTPCLRQCQWIWHGNIMSLCSTGTGEVHPPVCHTNTQEPPTQDPFPTLDRGASHHGSTSVWGNLLGKKVPNSIHLIYQNLDSIPQGSEGNSNIKLNALLQFINLHQVDIFAMTKLNTFWDLLPPAQCLPTKMKGWWENSHWSISHNNNNSEIL